jgi:NAD(P)-dependent dehydrogenase (short-subunit alcohol dehydrogenase family)
MPENDVFSVAGKVALVTGASGGLGRHFAEVLARRGARVGLAARRTDALESVATQIRKQGGTAAVAHMDVADVASIATAVSQLQSVLGPLDILVNNSGVSTVKPVLENTEEDWAHVVDVNLKGAFFVASEVARRMRATQRGSGSIINIESILSFRQVPQIAIYAASKAGLTQLTKSMAAELARYGIRVNGIAPGYFSTEINTGFFDTEAGHAMIKRIPQRRLGNLDDLDGPLLLLASDASRYMTGTTLVVDGGHLCSSL